MLQYASFPMILHVNKMCLDGFDLGTYRGGNGNDLFLILSGYLCVVFIVVICLVNLSVAPLYFFSRYLSYDQSLRHLLLSSLKMYLAVFLLELISN